MQATSAPHGIQLLDSLVQRLALEFVRWSDHRGRGVIRRGRWHYKGLSIGLMAACCCELVFPWNVRRNALRSLNSPASLPAVFDCPIEAALWSTAEVDFLGLWAASVTECRGYVNLFAALAGFGRIGIPAAINLGACVTGQPEKHESKNHEHSPLCATKCSGPFLEARGARVLTWGICTPIPPAPQSRHVVGVRVPGLSPEKRRHGMFSAPGSNAPQRCAWPGPVPIPAPAAAAVSAHAQRFGTAQA